MFNPDNVEMIHLEKGDYIIYRYDYGVDTPDFKKSLQDVFKDNTVICIPKTAQIDIYTKKTYLDFLKSELDRLVGDDLK